MPPPIAPRRKRAEARILDTIRLMDPSGYNEAYYQKTFARMSDADFDHFMCDLRDKKRTLVLYAPNLKVTLRMRNLLAAAHAVGLVLFERIRLWDTVTRRYFLTPNEYMILKLPVRRLKQYLMDKLSVPDGDNATNLLTGQVVKPDKGSAVSLPEAQTMDSKGLQKAMTELLNVRGGNPQAYASFKAALSETGQASLNDVDWSGGVRSAKIAEVFLKSMHLDNNLVGDK